MAASWPSQRNTGARLRPSAVAGTEMNVATQKPCRTVWLIAARSPAPCAWAAKAPTIEMTPMQTISRLKSRFAERPTAPSARLPTLRPMISVSVKFIASSAKKPAAIGAAIAIRVRISAPCAGVPAAATGAATGTACSIGMTGPVTVARGAAGGDRLRPRRGQLGAAVERLQRRCGDLPGVEAGLVVLPLGLVVVDEAVGQDERPDLQAVIEQPGRRQVLQHMGGEAADGPL